MSGSRLLLSLARIMNTQLTTTVEMMNTLNNVTALIKADTLRDVPGTAGLFRSENWLRTTHLFPPLENFPF